MQKLGTVGKIVVAAVIVAVIIIVFIVYGTGHNNTTSNTASTSTPVVAMAASSTPTSTQPAATNTTATQKAGTATKTTGSGNTYAAPKAPTTPSIVFVTPVVNDIWKIGTENVISWSKAGNFTGQLELLNAGTRTLVGVISPETGPDQTSYTWKTISVSLSRTNPSGENVVPGTYVIELAFDGNNLPGFISPTFTITN